MGREEASYDEEDDLLADADNDESFEDLDEQADALPPLQKRRMIEDMLEERRLRRQLAEEYDFLDDFDEEE
ncbi:hypothetical protein BFW38_12795 [Terasakiispira papahanaumokuakeensis]|uniref:Uncharacterized protein n=1 Tax=Terasakiispira papahanaumokuakeensis TaxID=197479 RepID=A0A1E2VBA3_9GAMM|nr:hypothetical protein [Terasakiispira papahanaumokuakeensis]ODC04277.1 hypothetical protein BFW38_12795 [Terasakiispira papahanaumokuakeensis]